MKKMVISLSILVYGISSLFSQDLETIFSDEFENYTTNMQLVCQNPEEWTTWNNIPCTSEDPHIVDTLAFYGTQSLVIVDSNNLVKPMSNYTHGKFKISFQMYIPEGEKGFFSVLQLFDGESSEVGAQWNFDSDGYLYIDMGALGEPGTYNPNTWMKNEIIIDLDEDWAEYFLNDELLVGWQWSLGASGTNFLNQLGGVNFKSSSWIIEEAKYYIDEFKFEKLLPPPENLSLNVINNEITLNWDIPEFGEWLNWDSGNNGNGIGINGDPFYIASRFEEEDFSNYDNLYLSKIKFFAQSNTSTYSLRAWEGENANTLLFEQDVIDFEPFAWNEIVLINPIQINTSEEFWFGYVCTSLPGEFPASCDDGPAIQFKGDMISMDSISWESMSNSYGLDYNWNIEAYFFDMNTLLGYNIYSSYNQSTFELIGFTLDTTYFYEALLTGDYGFYVTTLYEEGESIPSDTVTDYIHVYIEEPDKDIKNINIYPNPSSDLICLVSKDVIYKIKLFDILGGNIKEIDKINVSNFTFPVSEFEPGIYLLRIESGNVLYDKKIVIN